MLVCLKVLVLKIEKLVYMNHGSGWEEQRVITFVIKQLLTNNLNNCSIPLKLDKTCFQFNVFSVCRIESIIHSKKWDC